MSHSPLAGAPHATLPIVCFAIGDLYGRAEAYVVRLFEMIGRHCPQPRGGLVSICEAFVAGERYEQRVLGDQDFIRGVVLHHGLEAQVGHFPADQVVSFKTTVQLGRRDAPRARELIRRATVVKFHGSPKMHDAFSLRYGMRLRFDELLHGNLRPVLPMRELRQAWSG